MMRLVLEQGTYNQVSLLVLHAFTWIYMHTKSINSYCSHCRFSEHSYWMSKVISSKSLSLDSVDST